MTDQEQNRRKFLNSLGLVTTAAVFSGCTSKVAEVKSQPKTYPDSYDFNTYQDNLEAFVKILGDTSGKPSFLSATGRIYAVRDREQAIPLCAVRGMRYLKFKKTAIGYTHYTRDWAFYCDLKTGDPIDSYTNPITGEEVKTKQILTSLFSWEWTPNGQVMETFKGNAWLIDRPLQFPFTREGNDISTSMELLVQYASGAAGDEWMQLLADANDLNNPNLTSVPMRHSWTGNSGWMRWLNMGEIKGRTLWQSTGRKYSSIAELSPEFKAAAQKYFPGSLEAPETYEKVSFTTMPGTEDVKSLKEAENTSS